MTNKALTVGLLVLLCTLGCKRKDPREYPAGLPRAFIDEAIKMTEAIVPYCDDLLAIDPCSGPDPGWRDFRSDLAAKELRILDRPFGGSGQVHDYHLSCVTLEGHPSHVNLCGIRAFGPGTAPPAACEDHQPFPGWGEVGAHENGEMLGHPSGPGCPQGKYKLVVQRRTPKGGLATFIGNFMDANTASPRSQGR